MKGFQSRRLSLRAKFTLMIALMISAVGFSLGWYSYAKTKEVLYDELMARGKGIARNLAFNSRYAVLTEDKTALRDLLYGIRTERSVVFGRIYGEQGGLLMDVHFDREEMIKKKGPPPTLGAPPRELVLRPPIQNGDEDTYSLVAPVFTRTNLPTDVETQLTAIFEMGDEKQKGSPIGQVEIGISIKPMYEKLNGLVWFYTISTVVVIGIGVLFSEIFIWSLILPVKGMIRTAQEIAQGNMKRRVHVRHQDEIGELATIFNQMAQSLAERDEDLRKQYRKLELSHQDLSRVAAELAEYKEALERKVKERTEELAQKNLLLRGAMERAQGSDLLKTQFLANMSHELRTPLNAIIGFAQVLSEGMDGEVNETQKKDLEAIYQSGMHLLSIINDILDISKIEAGRMQLDLAEFDIGDVVLDVLSTAKPLVKEKDVVLRVELPKETPRVYADRIRIRQVILNLISNAAKFTAKGHILVRVTANSKEVEVHVADTGMGIRESDIPKLFNEFRQLDSSTTRNRGGAGLGLALAKRFVELHGGRIWVESVLGVGSTFSFSIQNFVKEGDLIERQEAGFSGGTDVPQPKQERG